MKLYIDTRNSGKILARIENGNNFFTQTSEGSKRPESILILIERLFKETGVSFEHIDEIKLEEGPGSYTGLKVGVSVANAISFILGIKINNKSLGTIIEPKYE